MRPTDLARCAELAAQATGDRTFRWPWQARTETGLERFGREWDAAVLEEVVFDGSGYVLGSYFLAQAALNHFADPFDAAESADFAKVFTAAWPVRTQLSLPELDAGALRQFCAAEWSDDPQMYEAVMQAHSFFKAGLGRVTEDEAVVFIIA
jgi:hypothetical protein